MEGVTPEVWKCGKCGRKFYALRGCDCVRFPEIYKKDSEDLE